MKLQNIENQFHKSRLKSENLNTKLEESEKKVTKLTCQLNTSEVKTNLLEKQVQMLEKDLKNQHLGTSDSLNDAIEVSNVCKMQLQHVFNLGEKCSRQREE